MPRLGVTVGKFYPPHLGHRRLIEFAQSRCDELVVIVGSRPNEDPPADLRIRWLRQIHPGVRFELIDDVYPEDPEIWATVAIRILGRTPDVAFTGDSMIEENIQDGDIIIVASQQTAENGQVVVALIDGNYATVKKFYRESDFIRLEPANPQFKPIFIKTTERLQIQGIVRGLIRKYDHTTGLS